MSTEFANHQREAMLRAIQEREARWDEVDPDTEVARIGNEIGLSEDQSYELFGHLVDEGFVDPDHAYRAVGAGVVASTAFEWTHARWNNAEGRVP